METEPDYKNYNLADLRSTYSHIDKDAYPERSQKLRQEIELRLKENQDLNEEPTFDEEYKIPVGNWFKLHWQGRLPLGLSYWINVFAIGIAFLIISPPLVQYLAGVGASPVRAGIIIIAFYVSITGIVVWQLTGLYRSADKHASRGGSESWATIAKLMVLIGLCRYFYDMSQTGIPFILESSRLVVGTSKLPPLYIRVMNQGTEVELLGGLEFGTSKKLARVLVDNPAVKIIHLNSMGGRIAEAKKLAAIVKKYKLITYSNTQCASACPIVFLAGKEKLLGDSAKLGFHSASFGSVSGSELKELNEELLSLLSKENVSSWFVKKVAKVSSDDVWNPSVEELIRAGVVDKVVDAGNYALSGVTDWQNPTTIDQEMQNHEIYRSLHQFDQEGYKVIRDKMIAGIQDGTPLNTISTNINGYLYVERLNYYMQLGGNDEVIQYMKSQISQMEYLRKEYPVKCAAYAFPELFDSNIIDDVPSLLPAALSEKETAAFNSLIKSLSTENSIADEIEQTQLISGVVKKMVEVEAIYGDILGNATKYVNEPEKLCAVGILLSKEINLLPAEKAGSLLRSFY